MRLIGINGFKGSGKDTVCKILQEELPGVQRVAFADNLKIAAAKVLGYKEYPPEDESMTLIEMMDLMKTQGLVISYLEDDFEITGRQYLQFFGQGLREVFGDSFWIDQVLPEYTGNSQAGTSVDRAVEKRYPDIDVLCITDVRYENEAERIRQLGGEIWEVIRPGLTSDGHSSEIPLDKSLVDATIDNDGTLEKLRLKVREAI